MNIQSWLPLYQKLVEDSIQEFFDYRYSQASFGIENTFESALRYAVEWGGKRLRPILTMMTYEYVMGVDTRFWTTSSGKELLAAIVGIEFMHCYTLVHDDLPCMDNDDLRRGKPTVWKVYGESMSLLVGDALQTISFELLSHTGNTRIITEFARALWDLWVVRGQVRDTFLRHDTLWLDDLLRIHDEKTWIFIATALVIGVILWGGDASMESKMRDIGVLLGRAFQIQDDILDAEWDMSLVWKKTGKDIDLGKWIVALLGISKAKELLMDIQWKLNILTQDLSDIRFSEVIFYMISRKS